MAVPDDLSLHNLTGTYGLNKTLSDDTDAILAMQGVSWWVRKGIRWSSIELHVKQYTDSDNKEHIDIEQVSTGGYSNSEARILDWEFRERDDKVFGKVKGRSRFLKLEDVEDGYLKEGWDEAYLREHGGEVIQSYVESVGKNPNWVADQIWCFAVVDGVRRHVRRVVATKGKEKHEARLVYDWKK